MTTTASTEITPAKRARMDAANERRRNARAAARKATAAPTETTPEPTDAEIARADDTLPHTIGEPLEGPAADPEPQPEPVTVPAQRKPRTPRTKTAAKAEKPTADPKVVQLAGELTKGDTVEIAYSGGMGVTLGKIYTAQFRALYPKGVVVKILNAEGKPVQEVVRRLERVASLKRA